MNKERLVLDLHQIGAIHFGKFTLKSGQVSSVYLDLRKMISYPSLLEGAADIVWAQIDFETAPPPDLVCGVPYTALPIATIISLKQQLPMVMRRKEKKNHGLGRTVEGNFLPGQNCLLIEDVVTTGLSLQETLTDLETAGLRVTDIAVLVDRQQGGREKLIRAGYRVHAALTPDFFHAVLHRAGLLSAAESSAFGNLAAGES